MRWACCLLFSADPEDQSDNGFLLGAEKQRKEEGGKFDRIEKFSERLKAYVNEGSIHPDDVEEYLQFFDLDPAPQIFFRWQSTDQAACPLPDRTGIPLGVHGDAAQHGVSVG